MMELTSDNLRLIQAYIRHYIGNEQYNEFIIMSVQVGDKVMTYENDDLILFLQNRKEQDNIMCNVSLRKEYRYSFYYFDNNINVSIIVNKVPQKINYNDIYDFNWDNIKEKCFLDAPEIFLKDITCVLKFNNPDVEHYCYKNGHVSDLITFVNDKDDFDTFYNNFIKSKKLQSIDIRVFQIDNNRSVEINKKIHEYTVNVKIDGIRTLVIIMNNKIKCYQGSNEIKFFYDYPHKEIEGTYIFDCELCRGDIFIFDCWYYNNDVSKLNFREGRLKLINEFCEKYDFINFEYAVGERNQFANMNNNYYNYLKEIDEFIENNTMNDIIDYLSSYRYGNEILSIQQYLNTLTPDNNENIPKNLRENVNKYIEILTNMYKTIPRDQFEETYNLCTNMNIDNRITYAFSPVILIGLIQKYYNIFFTNDTKDIKRYVCINLPKYIKNLPESFSIKLNNLYNGCKYPNDGLIFVENGPIKFTSKATEINDTIYYKWKPKDKLSFDVKIVFDSENIIRQYESNENYTAIRLFSSSHNNDKPVETNPIEITLNNFNKTLPMCENGDIVLSGDIVEVVPFSDNLITTYKFLKIRYDKIKPNGPATVNTIKKCQKDYLNIIF